jgi:endonuclease/exonuclease/phosphatase family metal-dependent hydrolase
MTRSGLTVLSWNMQARAPASERLDELLDRWTPDLLLLVEANGDVVAGEPYVADRYPHRFVRRGAGTEAGMAILSTTSFAETGVLDQPRDVWDRERVLWARLEAGPAAGLVVAAVHLRNPLGPVLPILPLDRAPRARQLRALTSWATTLVERGDRLLIGGDFNTHDCRLEGLTNAADAVGRPRATWRPYGIPYAPPVLRIDHLFLGGDLEPRSLEVVCRPTGTDHCALIARLGLTVD